MNEFPQMSLQFPQNAAEFPREARSNWRGNGGCGNTPLKGDIFPHPLPRRVLPAPIAPVFPQGGGGQGSQGKQRPRKKTPLGRFALLRERQAALLEEEAAAWQRVAVAKAAAEPFQRVFDAAHAQCASECIRLDAQRQQLGEALDKRALFAAYDARTVASGERGPTKRALETEMRCFEAIRRELKIVNEEIGI